MSILGKAIVNPLGGPTKPWKPWYGYLFVCVLIVSAGLYVYQRVNGGPVVPTSTDPVAVYENAKLARERQTRVPEPADDAPPIDAVMLADVAKRALTFIENTSIALPDVEAFSGDAIAMAAWIEEHDATVRATVIEDPSTDEIAGYLANNIPIVVPVQFADEPLEHWVVLDVSSQDAVLTAMVGNRIVIVEKSI